jgi:microsomal epoxide hydrolase
MSLSQFEIKAPETALGDLRERLARTRWPDQLADAGWDYGTNLDYLKDLCAYWRDRFDWRAQERELNRWPQFIADIDGVQVHFQHIRGKGPKPLPLIISHGWPGSFYEMHKVIGPLSDPASDGGDPADSFDVVVPSLPGFGYSGPTRQRGVSPARIAEVFHRLMTEELGYQRYAAQGGDFGASISRQMALLAPEAVLGIHLNMVGGSTANPRTDEEMALAEHRRWWDEEETGYQRIHRTKPQTLAYGLTDSPAGLAAWIVEKWRTWSDCDGDVEKRFTKDELLTNVMIYWLTGTINSSTRLYYEGYRALHTGAMRNSFVTVPVGVAMFPRDMIRATRLEADVQLNVTRWTEMPRGGHFAAMEEPELLAEDVRAFFRTLR